jgi:hypothetical protein
MKNLDFAKPMVLFLRRDIKKGKTNKNTVSDLMNTTRQNMA